MPLSDQISTFLFRRNVRGATRFHTFALGGRRIEVKSKHGLVFRLDPVEHVDHFVLHEGFYEEEVLAALLARVQPGEVFWDIGANLGLHALTVKRLCPDVHVVAFEPNPGMSGLIRAAVARNRLAVDVLEFALDVEAGPADFFIYEGNSGMSGLHRWHTGIALQCIEVAKITGDALVANAQAAQPNVLKIDVEGNERRVLQGMSGTLADRRLHTVVFEDGPETNSPVKAILHGHGFAIEPLERREATQHNLENFVAKR